MFGVAWVFVCGAGDENRARNHQLGGERQPRFTTCIRGSGIG